MDINKIHTDTPTDIQSNVENCSEERYLKKLHNVHSDIKLPDDFDTWTAQEQYDWKVQSIRKSYPGIPKSLQYMIPANFHPIDSHRTQEKLPEWIDIDKYRRGQNFVRNHYLSIVLNHILSIAYAATFDDGLKAFILGGDVHTPYSAFVRYLSTIKRILAWYDGEPWVKGTKAYKEIEITHKKHIAISKKLALLNQEQIDTASKIPNPWCPERELLLKDFATICPFGKFDQRPYKMLDYIPFRPKSINNADMSVVQGILMFMPLLNPKSIGLHGVTDKDLEAFCHMWRYYGYIFGMKDEYNFCRGSLEEIKQRTKDFSKNWLIANFKDIETDTLHVMRCAIESLDYFPLVKFPAKTMILYFTEALNLSMPNLHASLNYTEWFTYKFYMFMLRHALKFSVVRTLANRLLFIVLERASSFGSKKLTELHEKSKQQVPDFFINF